MKTEFNVERICDRVHLCVVDAPEELGAPLIEVRDGCVHVSFPNRDEDLGLDYSNLRAAVAESHTPKPRKRK